MEKTFVPTPDAQQWFLISIQIFYQFLCPIVFVIFQWSSLFDIYVAQTNNSIWNKISTKRWISFTATNIVLKLFVAFHDFTYFWSNLVLLILNLKWSQFEFCLAIVWMIPKSLSPFFTILNKCRAIHFIQHNNCGCR